MIQMYFVIVSVFFIANVVRWELNGYADQTRLIDYFALFLVSFIWPVFIFIMLRTTIKRTLHKV